MSPPTRTNNESLMVELQRLSTFDSPVNSGPQLAPSLRMDAWSAVSCILWVGMGGAKHCGPAQYCWELMGVGGKGVSIQTIWCTGIFVIETPWFTFSRVAGIVLSVDVSQNPFCL